MVLINKFQLCLKKKLLNNDIVGDGDGSRTPCQSGPIRRREIGCSGASVGPGQGEKRRRIISCLYGESASWRQSASGRGSFHRGGPTWLVVGFFAEY